jgi:hypothetical protein
MRSVFFDTGPIITLSMNNLLPILPRLKERFGGNFLITPGVKKEGIDTPMLSKKFKFEALQINKALSDGALTMYNNAMLDSNTQRLQSFANQAFKAKDNFLRIVHYTEMETLAGALMENAEAVVIDEYITRMLIESPEKVRERLMNKLHISITVDSAMLARFQSQVNKLRVIRSTELAIVAFETGLLDAYLPSSPSGKQTLLDGVLWGLKLNGCAVSADEIEEILGFENTA